MVNQGNIRSGTGYFFYLDFAMNISLQDTPGKNNLFRKSNAQDNELRHENGCVKSSSQLRGEHCKCSSDFFPSECPGLCPGRPLGF